MTDLRWGILGTGRIAGIFSRGVLASQNEAKELMAANKNLLKPQNGDPIVHPSKDIVLGSFWMTKFMEGEKGEGKYCQPTEN